MTRTTRKRLILIGIALLVLVAIVYGFLPESVQVETAVVERGSLQVIIEEEGETQVAETFVVSSPVAGYAQRIDLDAGDMVERGQPVVRLERPRSSILDPRSQLEARARVETAEASLERARGQVESAAAAAEEAREERERIEGLFEQGSATQQQLMRARSASEQAEAALGSAHATVESARAELTAARAVLVQDAGNAGNGAVADVLFAPVSGRVLAVHRKSEGQINPGEPLIEIGNVNDLEVRVDVLSQDAVRITSGTPVLLEDWGGEDALEAVVRRVEPQGFTQVSSLGVEEKRVTVIADLSSSTSEWRGLGAGYRVLARFIVWEGENVLTVPTSALFRTEDGWATFVVDGGTALRRSVEIGRQAGLSAEVVSGLEEGSRVVVHPPNDLEDGARVSPREG